MVIKRYLDAEKDKIKECLVNLNSEDVPEVLDHIETIVNHYLSVTNGKQNLTPSVIKKTITQLQCNIDKVQKGINTLRPYYMGELITYDKDGNVYDELFNAVSLLNKIKTDYSRINGMLKSKQGNIKHNFPLIWLIEELSDIFNQYESKPTTGRKRKRKVSVTHYPSTGMNGGAFIDFIQACVSPFKTISNSKLSNIIKINFSSEHQ